MKAELVLKKMKHSGDGEISYQLGDIPISDFVGKEISITFDGRIECVNCGRKLKKAYNQGHCFPCAQKLASCDICIVRPEKCHYRHGTCREPSWGEEHCLIPHIVYLSNTTGLKVGITREHTRFERWGDQGALSAILFAKVPERYQAGLLEVELKEHIADKTDWRKLLRGEGVEVNLQEEKKRLSACVSKEKSHYLVAGGENDRVYEYKYPVIEYLAKASSWNLLKQNEIRGRLQGIRGQYLLIEGKGLNVRNHTGYHIKFQA